MIDLLKLSPEDALVEVFSRNLDHAEDLSMARVHDIASNLRRAAEGIVGTRGMLIARAPLSDLVIAMAQLARVAQTTAEQLIPTAIRKHVDVCDTCRTTAGPALHDPHAPIDRAHLCEAGQVVYDNVMQAVDEKYTDIGIIAH